MELGKCAEHSGSVWNLQSFQVDVRVVVLRVQHNACGWMRISNMSRISVFNLSFEIRAKTTEKNYRIFGRALLVLHTRCNAFTEFCLRYEKSCACPNCLDQESSVMLTVFIAQYSLCLSCSRKHSFNKKSSFCDLRSCFCQSLNQIILEGSSS